MKLVDLNKNPSLVLSQNKRIQLENNSKFQKSTNIRKGLKKVESNIIDEYSIEIGVTQDPYIENNIDNLYKDVIDNLWIDDLLNLHPEIISAVTKKKISSTYGSKINKSFFVEILRFSSFL